MALKISSDEARGRLFAAARRIAGLDQAGLAKAAGVSGASISNVEKGHPVKPETLRPIKRALKGHGVSLHLDTVTGQLQVSAAWR